MQHDGSAEQSYLERTGSAGGGANLPLPSPPGLRRLLPCALGVWLACDLLTRIWPPAALQPNPQQAFRRGAGFFAPFAPSRARTVTVPVGDLASLANLAPREPRRSYRFSTNSLGFRHTPAGKSDSRPDLLVAGGYSFTFGSALDDADTLSAQLARSLARPVFNGAYYSQDSPTLTHLDWLLRHVGTPRLGVLYVYLDKYELTNEEMSELPHSRVDRLLDRIGGPGPAGSNVPRWRELSRMAQVNGSLWPARSACSLLLRRVEDDQLLPNRHAPLVTAGRLPGGQRMLLLNEDLPRCLQPPRPVERLQTVQMLLRLRSYLSRRGMPLRVLLVPPKIRIYGPRVSPALPAFPPEPGGGLGRIEAELQAAGVPTLNLEEPFHRLAVQREQAGAVPLYYLEDSHWTPDTVAWTARQAAAQLYGAHAVQ